MIAFTFGCNEIGIARRALRYAVTHFNIICSGFFRLVIPGISEITGGTAGRASAEGKLIRSSIISCQRSRSNESQHESRNQDDAQNLFHKLSSFLNIKGSFHLDRNMI